MAAAVKAKKRLRIAADAFWNRQSHRELKTVLKRERPDLVHCTNLFPQLSPAVYYAAANENIPVVQSLRNYRMFCPAFSF